MMICVCKMTTPFTPAMTDVTGAGDAAAMQMTMSTVEAEGWRGWMMSLPWMDMLGEFVGADLLSP